MRSNMRIKTEYASGREQSNSRMDPMALRATAHPSVRRTMSRHHGSYYVTRIRRVLPHHHPV